MYCYTVINDLKCVLSELEMWSTGSVEHHTFILKFADYTNKRLNHSLIDEIEESKQYFKDLNEEVYELIDEHDKTKPPYQYQTIVRPIRLLIQKFIKYDKNFLSILDALKMIGTRDNIWQSLIDHIIDEQRYTFSLMKNFKDQLK